MAVKKKFTAIEVPFKADTIDGEVHTMSLEGLRPIAIKYGRRSRNIVIVCEEGPTEMIDYSAMPWRELKALVESNGVEYTNKVEAIAFMQEITQ